MTTVFEQFTKDVVDHQMSIRHDDGLYRHLVFKSPAHGYYWFEIVTSPGLLTINGDMGCFVFRRADDMFGFFGGRGPGYINEGYWGEKVVAGRDKMEEYDKAKLEACLRDEVTEYLEQENDHELIPGSGLPDRARIELETVWSDIEDQILDDDRSDFVDGARELLHNFRREGFDFCDSDEWDLHSYSLHFLWNLHAITYAIRAFREWQAANAI